MENSNIPHLPITINENNINNGAIEILEFIRPKWKKEDVVFKLFADGITNKLVRCSLSNSEEDDAVLVRVYGNKTDLLIDRKAETRNILLLNKVGLAPRLYATFKNGLAYEYVPGITLSDEMVVESKIYNLVAKQMARFHKIKDESSIDQSPILWRKLQSFLDLVPDKFSNNAKQKQYEETIAPKSKIKEEISMLKTKLEKLESPVVFAHNDLLLGNVIYTKTNNSVTFIDYEYSALNYQAFDIGNHFSEFVGINNVDYSKYPNKVLQMDWLHTYLVEFNNREVNEEEIEKLYVQVNQFALISHIFWGIWSLIQAEHSYIDFDFMEYAAIRFNEYFSRRDTFLALEISR